MISQTDLLCVVDGDNMFRSMQAFYGEQYRVSYVKLKEMVLRNRPEGTCSHFSFFATVKNQPNTHAQLNFISRISMLGFEIQTFVLEYNHEQGGSGKRQSIAEPMIKSIMDFRCRDQFPKTLVICSASSAFADMYTALVYKDISIEVMHFGERLSPKIAEIQGVKNIVLTTEVLYKPAS